MLKKLLLVLALLFVVAVPNTALKAQVPGEFCPIGYYTVTKYEVDSGEWSVGGIAEIDQIIYSGGGVQQIIFHLLLGAPTIDLVAIKAGTYVDYQWYNPPAAGTQPPTLLTVSSPVQQGISNISLCRHLNPTAVTDLTAFIHENNIDLSIFLVSVVLLIFATGGILLTGQKRAHNV